MNIPDSAVAGERDADLRRFAAEGTVCFRWVAGDGGVKCGLEAGLALP